MPLAKQKQVLLSFSHFCFPRARALVFRSLPLSHLSRWRWSRVFAFTYTTAKAFYMFLLLVDRETFKNIRCCYAFCVFHYERINIYILFCFSLLFFFCFAFNMCTPLMIEIREFSCYCYYYYYCCYCSHRVCCYLDLG